MFFAPIFTDRVCSYIRTILASILIKDYGPFQQVWSCWIGVICHRYVPTFLLLRFLLTANVYSDQFFTTCLNLFDSLQARLVPDFKGEKNWIEDKSCFSWQNQLHSWDFSIVQLLSFKVIEREKSLYCKIFCNELFHLGKHFLPQTKKFVKSLSKHLSIF